MARDSSIFSFEIWRGLAASWEVDRAQWGLGQRVYALACLAVAVSYGVISPNDWLAGRLATDASIRVAYQPSDPQHPRLCLTSRDGLNYYPSELPAKKSFLVLGDSTSIWDTYPGWIERRSISEGERWEVLVAARQAANLYEMQDSLAYILANNGREFDAILVKPSVGIIWYLALDPSEVFLHPPIGSGYSLFYSGGPCDATRTSFFDHFPAALRRRRTDLYLQNKNRILEKMRDLSSPGPDSICTDQLPQEAKDYFSALHYEYVNALTNLIGIAKMHETPLVFLTTGRRVDPLNRMEVEKQKTFTPAYLGIYYLACFQTQLIDTLNDTLRAICSKEGVPLVDSAAYLAGLPQGDLFIDSIHIQWRHEVDHGKFIYNELTELYETGVLAANDPAQR